MEAVREARPALPSGSAWLPVRKTIRKLTSGDWLGSATTWVAAWAAAQNDSSERESAVVFIVGPLLFGSQRHDRAVVLHQVLACGGPQVLRCERSVDVVQPVDRFGRALQCDEARQVLRDRIAVIEAERELVPQPLFHRVELVGLDQVVLEAAYGVQYRFLDVLHVGGILHPGKDCEQP